MISSFAIRLSCQLKGALCSFQNLLPHIFEIGCRVPTEHFICHATEAELQIESAEFQHKPANRFSQKEFHSIKLKKISRFLFSNIT